MVPKDQMYSAASAVLLNELLKGIISVSIAFRNAVLKEGTGYSVDSLRKASNIMRGEVFS